MAVKKSFMEQYMQYWVSKRKLNPENAFLPRVTMIVGAVAYGLFIAQLLILNDILLYVSSALLGVGAAIIWTAQVIIGS